MPGSLLDSQLTRKNYLQISIFLDLVVVEQEKVFHALRENIIEILNKLVRRWLAGHIQTPLLRRQYKLLLTSLYDKCSF